MVFLMFFYHMWLWILIFTFPYYTYIHAFWILKSFCTVTYCMYVLSYSFAFVSYFFWWYINIYHPTNVTIVIAYVPHFLCFLFFQKLESSIYFATWEAHSSFFFCCVVRESLHHIRPWLWINRAFFLAYPSLRLSTLR